MSAGCVIGTLCEYSSVILRTSAVSHEVALGMHKFEFQLRPHRDAALIRRQSTRAGALLSVVRVNVCHHSFRDKNEVISSVCSSYLWLQLLTVVLFTLLPPCVQGFGFAMVLNWLKCVFYAKRARKISLGLIFPLVTNYVPTIGQRLVEKMNGLLAACSDTTATTKRWRFKSQTNCVRQITVVRSFS